MALTGGTLSTKIIELVGDLNIPETVKNINRSINEIERDLRQRGSKIKLDVELFGRVKDIEKDISALQRKINASSSIKNIKLGVELKDTTIKDINEQIRAVQKKVDGGSANQLKLEIDFDFKGSASKIKEELKDIQNFVQKYGKDMKNVDIINMDDDAQNVAKNADKIVSSIGGLDRGTTKVGQSIEGQMRKMTDSSGKFAVSFKQDVDGAINGATASITDADGTIRKFTYGLDENTQKLQLQSRTTKEAGDQQERLAQSLKGVEDAQRKLNEAISKSPQGLNRELIEQAEGHLKVARSMEEQGRVTNEGTEALKQLNNTIGVINNNTKNMKIAEEFKEMGDATNKLIDEFQRLGGTQDDVDRFSNAVKNMGQDSVTEMKTLQNEVKEATNEIIKAGNRIDSELSAMERQDFVKAIDERDIQSVKRYVEEIYGAQVNTMQLTQTNDKLGRSVDRLKVNMKEQNGVAKSYTLDMERGFGRAGTAIREVDASTKVLSTSNKGLGGSFGEIVKRVTQYVGTIEVLQAGLRAIQATIREILAIDAQMTELARVADPSLNLDILLTKSVASAKELGASLEEVVGSVAEMARTFGDYNEEQLIALANTATIMDNVSDLSLAESTETLVGAMNAFNISAQESIGIVDSLNEVDNRYAISTQQLAEGISRAGATAETFGVTMEQLTGDITAIGGVTMEAGSKIGNSLRTIYSRVTTMPDATSLLKEFGIAIHEMGAGGPQVREVGDILADLGGKWKTLSAEQQQSIGLAVAGRSRLTQLTNKLSHIEMCA